MRKLVGAAIVALVVLVLFAVIQLAAKNPASNGTVGEENGAEIAADSAEPLTLGIYSSEISDAGNGTAAVLQMLATGGEEGAGMFSYCGESPLADSILILDHPSVPGISGSLPQKIAIAVERCGFSYNIVRVADALGWKDAVVVAPTGALPVQLWNRSAEMAGKNLRLVVIESLPGRVIGENGTISPAPSGAQADFEAVPLSPSQENDAALRSLQAALAPKSALRVEVEGRGKELTVAIPIKDYQAVAHCRVYQFSNSSCRFSDTGKISKPNGRLYAKAEALSGESVDFEFSLGKQEGGRRLKLYAVDFAGRNEEGRQEVADGVVASGWAGRFSMKLRGEGRHTIWLVDQFGRRHASATVDVRGFSAALVKQSNNRLEFLALFGGEPLTGEVAAWIDGGGRMRFHSNNGTLIVWASPAPGSRTLHLSYLGMETESEIVFGESPIGNYLRLLAPALLFLLAVFLLLRAKDRVKYRIIFPQFAHGGRENVQVGKECFVAAWKWADGKLGGQCLPASAEEIGKCLACVLGGDKADEGREARGRDGGKAWAAQTRGGRGKTGGAGAAGRELAFSHSSVRRALLGLVAQGDFEESEGLFIPVKYSGGFSAWQNRALRLVHDILLENGLPFSKRRVVRVKRLGLEVAVFGGEKCVLGGIGRERRVVIFEDASSLAAFRKTLDAPTAESVRIKIAEQNGKVEFVIATRKGIEDAIR